MLYEEMLSDLTRYVGEQVLRGQQAGLEPTSPLLEWGVLNSLEIIRLLKYIEDSFGIVVPPREVTGDNLKDLRSIATLVTRLLDNNSTS